MHYALPQRKSSSKVPAYAIRPNRPGFQLRQIRPQFAALIALGVLAILYLLFNLFGASSSHLISIPIGSAYGSSDVVLVTVFRDVEDEAIREQVIQNRKEYAEKHGRCSLLMVV
jgi:hypothetical protein